MKRWPALAIIWINVLITALVSAPVFAQGTGAESLAVGAASKLIQQGILGTLAVLEAVVIFYLYRQVQAANAKFLDMAIKQTEIFAEATRTLKRNEEMIEKVLDVVIRNR